MKNIKLFLLSLLCLAGLSACMPEEYGLGSVDVTAEELVQGIAFSVTQDSEDPNTIYLKNLMKGYTPLWEHPQGRSQKDDITLKIAFKGEYTIKFGVETAGGYVYGEPYVLNLTTDNLSYVDDPMWNTLTGGGNGHSKTWKLDIDVDGCKYWTGPMYFAGTDDSHLNLEGKDKTLQPKEGVAAEDYNGDGTVDSWTWAADWAGNGSWLFGSTGAMDYGTMTFDLIDGAHVVVENFSSGTTQSGTFLLDTENYVLTLSDAGILHDPGRDAIVTQWGNARIITLTDDLLQLGVIRDNDPSEGPCLLVYNYISQDYWDNPPAAEEPAKPSEPVLPENWQDVIGSITQTSIKWTISEQNPLDWCNMDGSRMNGFTTPADYPDWLGIPDPTVYEGFSLTMDSADNSYSAVIPDGTEVTGTYTLDEKGIYTFDNGIPAFPLVGWANFATTAENQLRIMEVVTKNGIISEMWVGAKDPAKEEYMGYHLIANVGAAGEGGVTPPALEAKILAVDNSKLAVGDLEGNGNLRIEFYNEWGSTKENAPVDISEISFSQTMNINVTLGGIKLKDGAAGSYVAGVYYSNPDWSVQSDNKNETTGTMVTGNGTYNFQVPVTALAEGAVVFVIDVVGLSADLAEGSKPVAHVNKIVMDGELPANKALAVDNSKLALGDLEGNGNYRIELYNEWGSTKADPPVALTDISFSENMIMAVTFSGIQFKEGAVGSYLGGIYYSNPDWSVQSDNKSEGLATPVTGDGTYIFTAPVTALAESAVVYVLDVVGMAADLVDPTAVKVSVDAITLM